MPIRPNYTDKCPHCLVVNRFEEVYETFNSNISQQNIRTKDKTLSLDICRCTNCQEIIIFFGNRMLYPTGTQRPPCPEEIPENIKADYIEACLVEPYSKKSAAALARRCLQHILHDQNIKKKNLNEEIDEAISKLPTYLGDDIDAIRHIGNFAAHPMKYKNTSEIVEVEDGEAEWALDVIEQLFDFYYMMPKKKEEKRATLNSKLENAGKPQLKNTK